MALKKPLEANLEKFYDLLAKWFSGSLWRFILSNSGACSPNDSQEAS